MRDQDRNRGCVSVSAATFDRLCDAAEARRVSLSSLITGLIEQHTPPIVPPRAVSAALPCTKCKRSTVHRRVTDDETARWECGNCGRAKLVERSDEP